MMMISQRTAQTRDWRGIVDNNDGDCLNDVKAVVKEWIYQERGCKVVSP